MYEQAPASMANFMSNTMNLFLTAIFFCPLIPISLPICTLGMLFEYGVEKVRLYSNLLTLCYSTYCLEGISFLTKCP